MGYSSEYEIQAQIKKNSELVGTIPLNFSGETSLFDGKFMPEESGTYNILVYAFHPKTGNSGVAETTFSVK